jgi:metal-responsive CopG/Arc/MetJ family transcriptional regulator
MTTQLAVRLEDRLLAELDWLIVRCSFENRADVVRAAIAALAKVERERDIDERMIAGYTAMPQTDDELSWCRGNDWSALDDDDWSDWQ